MLREPCFIIIEQDPQRPALRFATVRLDQCMVRERAGDALPKQPAETRKLTM